MAGVLQSIGALLGTVAFIWKVWETFRRYLQIDLSTTTFPDGSWQARTKVQNNGTKRKRIDHAFLLIGPEGQSPVETANDIALTNDLKLGREIKHTNDISQLDRQDGDETTLRGTDGRALISIPFYYSENTEIGDERLTYTVPLPTDKLLSNTVYSVRFFIETEGRLHRSTQDVIKIGRN